MAKRKKKFRKSRKDEENEEKEDKYQILRPNLDPTVKRWIAVIILFGLALLSALALAGGAGRMGAYLKDGLVLALGWGSFVFPIVLIIMGYFLLTYKRRSLRATHYLGIFLLVVSFSGLLHLFLLDQGREVVKYGAGGGYIGYGVSYSLNQVMGVWATLIILLILFFISILIIFESWFVKIKEKNIENGRFWRVKDWWASFRGKLAGGEKGVRGEGEVDEVGEQRGDGEWKMEDREEGPSTPRSSDRVRSGSSLPPRCDRGTRSERWRRVKIDLPLDLISKGGEKAASGDIERNKSIIQKTLQNFGIIVEMGEVKVGPTVSQYTLKPAEGVKISKIVTLQNDLALALAAHPIRIEAPIPGRSLVGIEVPNEKKAIVMLRELLEREEFKKRTSNLTLAIGKDVAGNPWLADLDKLPHLLIAGATGSGKSVCLNSIIVALLYQNSSEDLKFILIDPKRVELTIYNGIPHLLTPVITDVPKVISALKWTVGEMERRFHRLSEAGRRDIRSYNKDKIDGEKMPYIIFAVDELADLMTAAGAEVENLIIRLAQMSRAVGIHLILATQRPSVDIITGLIKANISARIAFSVVSLVDSRTILDVSGAEKLLGGGDMLYISAEFSKPRRLQGAFLSDKDIENVVRFIREWSEPDYDNEVVDTTEKPGDFGRVSGVDLGDADELYGEAKEVVIRAGKASASLLQRRLRIGYARAARLLDLMEEEGAVGPADGAKPREVMIGRDRDVEGMDGIEDMEDGDDSNISNGESNDSNNDLDDFSEEEEQDN